MTEKNKDVTGKLQIRLLNSFAIYVFFIAIVFCSELVLESVYPAIKGASVLYPLYFVRLSVILYVLLSIKYAHIRFAEILTHIRQLHNEEAKYSSKLAKIQARIDMLLGNSKLHIFLVIVGILLYNFISYSSLNPLPLSPGDGRVIPVPIVNHLWGGFVLLGFVICFLAEISLFDFEIREESINPNHNDGVGGYKMVVEMLSKIFAGVMFGAGIFFVSFYYLIDFDVIAIVVAFSLGILFSIFFLVTYRIHKIVKGFKDSEIAKEEKKLDFSKKELDKARIEGRKAKTILEKWIDYQECERYLERLKTLKTWPLSTTIAGRLSLASVVAFLGNSVVQILIEIFI